MLSEPHEDPGRIELTSISTWPWVSMGFGFGDQVKLKGDVNGCANLLYNGQLGEINKGTVRRKSLTCQELA